MFHDKHYFHTYSRHEWAKTLLSEKYKSRSLQLCMSCVAISLIIQILLLCSGIHPNPGPQNKNYADISIFHVNIRSLKSRDGYGTQYKLMHIKRELTTKFDIITVSETWLTSNDKSSNYNIPNYQSPFQRDR